MTYINSLIVIIQDRINHLEEILKHYDDGHKDSVVKEINALENILNILVGLDN
jgi:hypothetical protein